MDTGLGSRVGWGDFLRMLRVFVGGWGTGRIKTDMQDKSTRDGRVEKSSGFCE